MSMPLSPAIQITASPAASDKSSAASPPDTTFNHVLSNEMSQQQNAKTAAAAANPPVTQAAAAADKSKKTAAASQAADAANAAAPLQAALPPISAELLAMMGNYPAAHAAPAAPTPVTGASGTVNVKASPVNNTPAAARYQQEVLTTPPLLSTSIAAAAGTTNHPSVEQAALPTPLPVLSKFADTLKTAAPAGAETSLTGLQLTKNLPPIPIAAMMPLLPNPATIANPAQATATAVATGLAPSVGTAAWNQALGEKIVWMSGSGGEQTASLSLNPPDLGPLQVVLNVTNNQANATFIAAQPEVRLAIEAALPRLHEMMNNAGIQLGQTNVRSDTSSQQDRQSEAQSFRPLSGVRSVAADKMPDNSGKIITGKGLVNTFV